MDWRRSIAEKEDFGVIGKAITSYHEALDLADKLIHDGDERIDDKWGPAGYIKIKGDGFLFFGWAST